MDEVTVIKCLQDGRLENGCKKAIKLLTECSDEDELRSQSKFAARVLAVLNKQGQHLYSENAQVVVDCVLLCYDRLESHPIDWKHPLDLEKYIYNFTVNVAKKNLHSHTYKLAKRLLEDFKVNYNKEPQSAKTMSYNLYYNLWDCSNNLAYGDHEFELVFQIRSIAVFFYLLNSSDIYSCQEKVLLTVEKLDSSWTKCKNSIGTMKNFEKDVRSWCESYCKSLLKPNHSTESSTDDSEEIQRFSYCLEMVYKVSKYLHKWNSSGEASKLEKSVFEVLSEVTFKSIGDSMVPTMLIKCMQSLKDLKPKIVLSSTENMLRTIKETADESLVLHLCKAVTSLINHVVFMYKSSQTKFSSSVGITMTAYGHMTWDEQSAIEDIFLALSEVYELELRTYLQMEKGAERSASERNRMHKRIKQLVTCRVIAKSDCVYIKASRIYKQDKSHAEKFDVPVIILECEDLTKEISRILCEELPLQPSVKLAYEEHVHCGFMMYKLGRVIGNRSSHKESVQFFKRGLKHYKLYNSQASSHERQKQQIQHRYDALVSAQRKSLEFEGAMRSACESVLVCPSHVDTVAEMWQVIKHDVNKQRGANDKLVMRTMWQEIQHICVDTGQKLTVQPEKVYEAELRACKDKDVCPVAGKYVLLDQYLLVAKCPALKARLLLDKAQMAWTKRDHKYGNAVCLVEEAVDLLESSDKSLSTYYDDMAMAQVILYVVQDVDVIEMEKTRDKKKQKDKEKEHTQPRPDSPLEGLEEAELYQNATTLGDEHKAITPALKALDCWRSIDKPLTKHFRDQLSSLDAMMLLTEVFKLLFMTTQEAQMLEIILPLCKQPSCLDPERAGILLQSVFSLCKLLNTNTQPHISVQVIKETQEWLVKKNFEVVMTSQLYFNFLGMWAETQLMLNEVEEGWMKLQQALELKEKHIRSRTKEDLELEGYLRRLQSRYLSLPDTHWPKGPPESKDWALEVIIRGARSIGGVICSLLGPSFINIAEGSVKQNTIVLDNVLEKWVLLEQLLEMFQETGTVFLQLGDARDAKCYLQQGLLITQTMRLPKRLAYFHLLMARLDNICGKFQDSRAHLHTVAYILNTKHSTKTDQSSSGNEEEKNNQEKKKSFGEGLGDNEFEIKSQTLEFEEHLTQFNQEGPVEQAASPKHQKEQFEVPEFWSHDSDCMCDLCGDVETLRLGLMYVLCYSELYIMEGKHQLGRQYLQMLLAKVDHFTSKSVKILNEFVTQNIVKNTPTKGKMISGNNKGKSNDDLDEGKEVKSCTFQNVLIEGCKLMVYMALIDLDLEEHQEWTKRMQSLLKLDCYPWTVTAWVDMAESHHLGVTPSLPWPPGDPPAMEVFDMLCKEVEGLSLDTEEVRNCATPMAVSGGSKIRSRLGVGKAPVKKRRGLLGSEFETPDPLTIKDDSAGDSPLGDIVPPSPPNTTMLFKNINDKELTAKPTKPTSASKANHRQKLNKSKNVPDKVALPKPNLSGIPQPELEYSPNTLGAYSKLKAEVHGDNVIGAKPKTGRLNDSKESRNLKPKRTKNSKVSIDGDISTKAPVRKRKSAKSTTIKAPSIGPPLKTNLKSNVLGAQFLDSPEQKFKIFTENRVISNCLKPMTDEEVYNFICSSPDATPLVRKKTGKKTVRKADTASKNIKKTTTTGAGVKKGAAAQSVETSRSWQYESQAASAFDAVCHLNLSSDTENRITSKSPAAEKPLVRKNTLGKPNRSNTNKTLKTNDKSMSSADTNIESGFKKASGSSNTKKAGTNSRRNMNRVTRSRTVIEEQRYDSECESDELVPELDVSGLVVVSDHCPSSPDQSLMGIDNSLGDSPMIERRNYYSLVESPLLSAREPDANTFVSPAVLPPEIEFSPIENQRQGRNLQQQASSQMDDVIKMELQSGNAIVFDKGTRSLEIETARSDSVALGEVNAVDFNDEEIEMARGGDDEDSDCENKPPIEKKQKSAKAMVCDDKKGPAETGVEMPRKTVIKQRAKGSTQGGRGDTLCAKMDKLTIVSPHKGISTTSGSEIKHHLLHAFNLLKSHPPSVPYRNVCHALATLEINEGNQLGAVFYMTEAQSVIFRHNALMNISKKIRKLSTMTKGLTNMNVNEQTVKQRLYEVGDVLAFNKTSTQINTAIQSLPTGWTVCQLSVMKSPSQESGEMFITHMTRDQPLLLHRLPGFSTSKGQKILVEFEEMMRENIVSMHITVRQEWWSKRRALDIKFGSLLDDVVSVWLAGWKCLLLGLPSEDTPRKLLKTAVDHLCSEFGSKETFTDYKKGLVKVILNGCHLLQDRELLQMLCEMTINRDPAYLHSLSKAFRARSETLDSKQVEREPVILILDRLVQHLPWESLSLMRSQPVSRVPNLYFLQSLLQQQMGDPDSLYNTGMDPQDTYFILDPESNLTYTQETFKEWFKKEDGWNGIVGKIPSLEEYKTGLTRDLFLYCGHGGGNRFLSGDIIQTMQCRSCALIMGCSSGKLTVLGHLEASGLTLNYFLAGSPCIIANLWDVTDKDIDRFTEELLKTWLSAEDGTRITDPFEQSRQACRLTYLIGAAPVMYGIPLKIRNNKRK